MTAPALHQLLDALAVAVIGIFAIVGTARGMLRGVLRIVAFLAALVVGRFAAPILGPALATLLHWDSQVAFAFVWIVVSGLVVAALGVCLLHWDPWIEKGRIAILDPILGLVLGAAFGGVLVMSAILMVKTLTSPNSVLAKELDVSHGGQLSKSVAEGVKPIVTPFLTNMGI